MMKTPIVDFVRDYAESGTTRFHMPGHKGESFLGCEKYDITEIEGADLLSRATGIINESEEIASSLFSSTHSFYVTEGSTTAICAMLALVRKPEPEKTVILAARNVHKAFVNACALLDIEIRWLMPEMSSNILECKITAEDVERELQLCDRLPDAVYLTSPDYLGNLQDITGISKACKKYGVLLLVDNAHGAYLKFLDESLHPLDMGADICCDSAHKTLPVLTGGAYLHISKNIKGSFCEKARGKLSLFSSTSPSYLILQSLDLCNAYLSADYRAELAMCVSGIKEIKSFISERGFFVTESEPLKIVIDTKKSGFYGNELAEKLRKYKIEPEFCDDDFLVLMITPQNKIDDFERLREVFSKIVPGLPVEKTVIPIVQPETVMSVRRAVLADYEVIDVSSAEGRVCAELTVSCPPAVPIAVSGEIITEEIISIFKKYGISEIKVVK